MKNLFLFFALFVSFVNNAQIVKGVVKDKSSQEGIGFITVSVENTENFVVTNEQGEFQFNLDEVKGKNILIDNIYFESYKQLISNSDFINIQLNEIAYQLEEMVMYNQPIKKVMEDIVSNSEKKMKTNAKISTYFRDDYYKDGKKYFFADALIDFYVKNKTTKIDAVVTQSRLVDSNTKQQLDQVDLEYSASIAPDEIMESGMHFKVIKNILNDDNYEFVVTSKKANNKTLHTLYVEPKETATDRFLFKGKVVYDDVEKLIYEMDFEFAEDFKKFNKEINVIIVKVKINDLKRKAKYNYANNMYYVTHIDTYFDFFISANKGKKTEGIKGSSEVITLGIENATQFPTKNEIFKKKYLFKNGNKFTYEFWKDDLIKNYIK